MIGALARGTTGAGAVRGGASGGAETGVVQARVRLTTCASRPRVDHPAVGVTGVGGTMKGAAAAMTRFGPARGRERGEALLGHK